MSIIKFTINSDKKKKVIEFSANEINGKIQITFTDSGYRIILDKEEIKDHEEKTRIMSIVRSAEFNLEKAIQKITEVY